MVAVGPANNYGYTRVFGDGTNLYTSAAYGAGSRPYITSPESDGITWRDFNAQTFDGGGPYEMAFDKANGILYSSAWYYGLLALKVSATVSDAFGANAMPPKENHVKLRAGSGPIRPFEGNDYDMRGKLLPEGK